MAAASTYALVRVPVERAYRVTVGVDPAAGFYPRFGPLPAVVSVDAVEGPFDRAGSSRMLRLSDGGTVRETVVTAEAPRHHAYRLTGFERLFGRLVADARADWRFSPYRDGTRIDWTYDFRALPGRGPIVAVIVRALWAPYMRRVISAVAHEVGRTG